MSIMRCLRQVHISCVEIYNEAAFDLLATARDQVRSLEDLQRVHMLEDAEARVHLRNLSVHRADTEEAALNLVRAGTTQTPTRVGRTEGGAGCICLQSCVW
jgi:Kinesin motor domain